MAKALKKLADRKFASFEKEMVGILERTYHEEEDSNMVKEKKKETETCTTKYEESICWLDSVYSAERGNKRKGELKDIEDTYKVLEERRDSVRRIVKEVNAKIEERKNEETIKQRAEETRELGERQGRPARKAAGDKQFKQPSGALPEKISR